MLPYLAKYLTGLWGPFRLLESHLVLSGIGTVLAAFLTWYLLPRTWHWLPRDRGRENAQEAAKAVGKPTGSGIIHTVIFVVVAVLVIPWGHPFFWNFMLAAISLALCSLFGYLDDRSQASWGRTKKGLLDLAVALLAALATYRGPVFHEIWVPFYKNATLGPAEPTLVFWLHLLISVSVLWICINTVNCSDGIDGLAGSLSLFGLFSMGVFLFGIVGHLKIAAYLQVPHNPSGAVWAIMLFTAIGALAGYLWHNAYPSAVLMGDGGSRFLGMLLGLSVIASGNPFMVLVAAPVLFINGGAGLLKIGMLKVLKRLGYNTKPPLRNFEQVRNPANFADAAEEAQQIALVRLLHTVRCPLHDHCRKKLGWSGMQVVMRFMLVQAFLTPVLLLILLKIR